MCGIAGSISSTELGREHVRHALHSMKHRGPDSAASLQKTIGSAHLVLLHARLSIIDLDARSNQPFSKDGLHVSFNGEIYNYLEIRSILERQGYVFKTASDTEVLLEAYRAWGDDFLDKLEGMWAFALFDEGQDKLLLSRDRFGEKPLYLLEGGEALYFASEPKTLAALTGNCLEVDLGKISEFLVNGFRSIHKTNLSFFVNVRSLPPATCLTIWGDGSRSERKYWSLRYQPEEMTDSEAVDGVRRRLLDSMRLRIRSDVPVAFCLSGGVDSTGLVSVAVRELGCNVHAFSLYDSDERYDERENVTHTVQELGIQHDYEVASTEKFFEGMQELVAFHDAPVPTISYYIHSKLSELIQRRGCKVAFSGTAADELFTGYYDHFGFWFHDMAKECSIAPYIDEWRNTYGRWVNNPLIQDPLTFVRHPEFRGHIYQNRELFQSFMNLDKSSSFFEAGYTSDLLRNRMMNELFHEVVPVILMADDANSMRCSIENRSPFLDRKLVEFAFTIPSKHLIKEGLPKWPLRRAIAGWAPQKIISDTRKRGFNASINSLVNRNEKSTRDVLLGDSKIFELVKKEVDRKFFKGRLNIKLFFKVPFQFYFRKNFPRSFCPCIRDLQCILYQKLVSTSLTITMRSMLNKPFKVCSSRHSKTLRYCLSMMARRTIPEVS